MQILNESIEYNNKAKELMTSGLNETLDIREKRVKAMERYVLVAQALYNSYLDVKWINIMNVQDVDMDEHRP